MFRPVLPLRYDGTADPAGFLQAYSEAIRMAGGDDKVMASWFHMALAGEPRAWFFGLPESSVASWGELCDLFVACFAVPALPAVAALLGGLRASVSDRHIKQFIRQAGAAPSPPGGAAPEAVLTFDSSDHPASPVGAGALPMLCTPTICSVAVTKTLIDGSAGLNVLSVEAFGLLHVPHGRLRPTKPFFGVVNGSTGPLG
jgi:hypothetical protein